MLVLFLFFDLFGTFINIIFHTRTHYYFFNKLYYVKTCLNCICTLIQYKLHYKVSSDFIIYKINVKEKQLPNVNYILIFIEYIFKINKKPS